MSKDLKETQGHRKMLRYLQDLIRNKDFQKSLKRYRRLLNKGKMPEGMYPDWTPEQQKEHDQIDNELGSIFNEYEILRKRCKKLLKGDRFKIAESIADTYGLDYELLGVLDTLREDKKEKEWLLEHFEFETDMCRFTNLADEQLIPFNKGEEIIHLQPHKQLSLISYPVTISIHKKASKRDVLDFIEKRWPWINQWMDEKALKYRPRKISQEILDFIWERRSLPAKKIKEKIDEAFPHNGLVYFEISKIISLEKRRRLETLS
jgi:hypothetical protein